MKREEMIEVLVHHEVVTIKQQLEKNDEEYLRNIVKYGGVIGFKHLSNDELEDEYAERFGEIVRIT